MNPNNLTRTLLDIAKTPTERDPIVDAVLWAWFEPYCHEGILKLQEIADTFSDDERFTEREPEEDPQTGWTE